MNETNDKSLLKQLDDLNAQLCRLRSCTWIEGDMLCQHDHQYLAVLEKVQDVEQRHRDAVGAGISALQSLLTAEKSLFAAEARVALLEAALAEALEFAPPFDGVMPPRSVSELVPMYTRKRGVDAAARRAELWALLPSKEGRERFRCTANCGTGIAACEDGTCATCGADVEVVTVPSKEGT